MIAFEREEYIPSTVGARVKVLGVGGAGCNTVNAMIEAQFQDIECVAVNTDAQALRLSKASKMLQIGSKSTKGLGAGANPELGRQAAEEDAEEITKAIQGADVVFLTGGLGGGTGSGALPVIARLCKKLNILCVALVTKPFAFEGKRRAVVADQALELLKKEVDTLLVIPNQKLLSLTDANISLMNAFAMINKVIGQCIKSVTDIIFKPGHINVDFADVRAIMTNAGFAVMGTGTASGKDRATEAALQAICSPLLDHVDIKGARGVLINITGNSALGLHEIAAASSLIYEQAHEDANIILGSVIDETCGDALSVTIIASNFEQAQPAVAAPKEPVAQPKISEQPLRVDSTLRLSASEVAQTTNQDIEVPTILRRMIAERQAAQKNNSQS